MLMTPNEAENRLYQRYDLHEDFYLTIGDVMLAEEALRALAPFKEDVDLEDPPEALLDWVALEAYRIQADDEEPHAEVGMESGRVVYATPKASRTARRQRGLIGPYLLRAGRRV